MADTKDYEQLAQKLHVLAQKGDAKSQYHLGVLYNDGKGVEKDYQQAASWYLKAAQQGHQKAQLYLGLLYQNGRGVARDYKQATQWFTKSAEQGEQKAQYFLGVLYYKGIGVTQDLEQAALWLEQSVNQGNADAKRLLDEILSISELESKEIDTDDDEAGIFDNTEREAPSHSRIRIIPTAVVGMVILTASVGVGYYLFSTPQVSTARNLRTTNLEQSVTVQASTSNNVHIDVFKLACTGTPKQLKDAVNYGANFNVTRSLEDTLDNDIDEQLFEQGETPLHYAASYNKNPGSIRFLISLGLDVNAEASTGTISTGTPLSCAVSNGNIEAVRELLRAGANPNSYSSEGNMIQIAIFSKGNNYSLTKNIIEALIKSGCDINARYEAEEVKSVLLPMSQWTSQEPLDNILDDIIDTDVRTFIASCPAICCAVLNDSPELVNFLLNAKADPTISNSEGRIPLYYAEELPDTSRLKKSDAFRNLQSATKKSIRQKITSARDDFSARYLNDLLNRNNVPDYISKKGTFFCNPQFLEVGGMVQVKGSNVRMRSQPNTDARIIAQLNEDDPASFHAYIGEWTDTKGDKWVLVKYFDDSTTQLKTAWIFGKYTGIMTAEEHALILDNIVEAENYSNNNDTVTTSQVNRKTYMTAQPSLFSSQTTYTSSQSRAQPAKQNLPASRKFQNHQWMCESCGNEVKSSNMPQPGNSCSQNPAGKFHSWIDATADGKRHQWKCAYCGRNTDAGSMPKPSNSCSKNPYGKKFHKWIQTR